MQASLLFALAAVAAIDAPEVQLSLSSDRPGISYSVAATPPGRITTELGVRGVLAAEDSLAAPIASVRFGLLEGLELQVGLPAVTIRSGDDGLGDAALGLKWAAQPAEWAAYSVVGFAILPIGDADFTAEQWQLVATGNLELYLYDSSWIALNAQWDTFTDDGDRRSAFTPSLALGWTFFDALNPFVQGYLRITGEDRSPFFGAGVAYLFTPRVQVDVSVDYDVDAEAAILESGVAILW